MDYSRKGVRTDLVILWRDNFREIMKRLNITYRELADMCGVSKSGMSVMLTRSDLRLTVFQFLGTMHAMEALLATRSFDATSYQLFDEIEDEWSANGLKEGK